MNLHEQSILDFMFQLLPNYPKYVVYEWIWKMFKDDPAALQFFIKENPKVTKIKWNKQSKFITIDDFDEWSSTKLQSPLFNKKITDNIGDAVDHLTKIEPNPEPIIVLDNKGKFKLIDGWHRTTNNFKLFPDGFYCELYIGYIS